MYTIQNPEYMHVFCFCMVIFAGGGRLKQIRGDVNECVCVCVCVCVCARVCFGRVSCLTQSVQAHVSVRVSVSQQSAMSDTKCQFRGTKSLFFPLFHFLCRAQGKRSQRDRGGFYCTSRCQGGRQREIMDRDKQLEQGRLKNMLMCYVCGYVGSM